MSKRMHPISENKRSGRQWKCPSCGNVNDLKSKECLGCGMSRIPTQNMSWICPTCESVNSNSLEQCAVCGRTQLAKEKNNVIITKFRLKVAVVLLLLLAVIIGTVIGICTYGSVICSYEEATKTLTISGIGPMMDCSFSETPWDSYKTEIETVKILFGVTSIADSAFSGCTSLTSVTIPGSVTTIHPFAFTDCESLTSIYIPASVKRICFCAFGSSEQLKVYYAGTEKQWKQISTLHNIADGKYFPVIADEQVVFNSQRQR